MDDFIDQSKDVVVSKTEQSTDEVVSKEEEEINLEWNDGDFCLFRPLKMSDISSGDIMSLGDKYVSIIILYYALYNRLPVQFICTLKPLDHFEFGSTNLQPIKISKSDVLKRRKHLGKFAFKVGKHPMSLYIQVT